MALVGLLGLLLPLIVVLYVSEFLIYDSEGFSTSFGLLTVIPALLALGILGALLLGLTKGALKHIGWLLRLLFLRGAGDRFLLAARPFQGISAAAGSSSSPWRSRSGSSAGSPSTST